MIRKFSPSGDGGYVLECLGFTFSVSRLEWHRGELHGLLTVMCDVAGADTVNGTLSVGTFNLTSVTARRTRAKDLAAATHAEELDCSAFALMLETLCQQTIAAEERGKDMVLLRDIKVAADDADVVDIDGFPVLLNHPSIIFGDGGTGKSTLGLYLAGRLEQQSISVAYLDWELDGRDHHRQLRRLFGSELPDVKYVRCDRPLTIEAQGLARQIREGGIQFVICDSIAFACDGPPEQADVAQRYLRAVRQLGVGSLHFAHMTKSEGGDKRPFGSTFWYNGARQVWFAKRDGDADGTSVVPIALIDRKFNLGGKRSNLAFEIEYSKDRIIVTPCDVTKHHALARELPIATRIRSHLHNSGSCSIADLARHLDEDEKSVRRAIDRNSDFQKTPQQEGTAIVSLVPRRRSA